MSQQRGRLGSEGERRPDNSKTKSRKSKAKQDEAKPENRLRLDENSDRQEIFNDTSHIPDRDQMFAMSSKKIGGQRPSGIEDGWRGDDEGMIKGDRDFNNDAFEEIRSAGRIHDTRGAHEGPHEQATPADMEYDGWHFEELSKQELMDIARVLGVPGRESMSRHQLVSAIKTQQEH